MNRLSLKCCNQTRRDVAYIPISVFYTLLAISALLPLSMNNAHAEGAYPSHAIRFIVPYATGGNGDLVSRIIAQKLTETLGQQLIVDNRVGGTGIVGADIAAKSPADGYTLLSISSPYVIAPGLFPKLPFDPIKDFAAISMFASVPLAVVVAPKVPVTTIKELIALSKTMPGKLNFASAGNASAGQLAGALFNVMAGVNIVHVPYKATAQAFTDVMSGDVQIMYPSLSSVLVHIKSGKIRGLALTSQHRSALAPDLPTVDEAGLPGYEASIWSGVLAPARTPAPIIKRLNETLVALSKSPDVRERFLALGAEPTSDTPAAFESYIVQEIKKWTKVIKDAGVHVD